MGMLDKMKERIDRLQEKGVKVAYYYVNPMSLVSLADAIRESGQDPYPESHFNWRHPFRERDNRMYLWGKLVGVDLSCPIGSVGIASETPFPQGDPDSPTPAESDESPILGALAKDASTGSPTDVLVMAMDGIEKYNHVIVLRFHPNGYFDSLSTYNKLELPTVMHKALSQLINGQ